jgi:outer membrane lipoprotein-sorting protein
MRTQAVLLFGLLAAANAAQAIGVDELIAKNEAARGGADKIAAIKTLNVSGHLRVSGGFGSIELGFAQYKKAPDSVRIEASVQGLTQVQAWDGKEAWQISPFQGRKDPERLSADDAKPLADDASISGSLIDYKAKGSKVEYLGTEDVDGTEAHKLKVTLKTGDTEYVYLDPDSYLEIRVAATRKLRGTESIDVSDFGDYEQVNGVYFPFSISTHNKDGSGDQQITIDKAEANASLDDSQFAFPKQAAK